MYLCRPCLKTHGIILILCKLLLIAKNVPFLGWGKTSEKTTKKNYLKLKEEQQSTCVYVSFSVINNLPLINCTEAIYIDHLHVWICASREKSEVAQMH